jgi:NADPH-dependent curcumin reductase CurA
LAESGAMAPSDVTEGEVTMSNRQIVLERRPVGAVDASTTRLVEGAGPTCGPGEALIKVGMLSIDPTIRTWMNDAPGYLAPIGIGEVIRSAAPGSSPNRTSSATASATWWWD